MRERNHVAVTILFVLSVSVLTSSITAMFLTRYRDQIQYQRLGQVLQGIIREQPESRQAILEVLKDCQNQSLEPSDANILRGFGYHEASFSAPERHTMFWLGLSLTIGIGSFLAAFWLWHRWQTARIRSLTFYLEKVNMGGQGVLLSVSEDEFSKLQDEVYKTVTKLSQTKEAAIKAKINFADNLSNIAHQLKTPITAISLSLQMMEKDIGSKYPAQIQRQLKRLIHLEEALLLISRIDAGTLVLRQEAVDVFTVLTLAADNLQELFMQAGVSIDIPEMGEMEITADLDWTMEAIMNLFKNCLEHTPSGNAVHCSYEQNPLYTQIRIWDEGGGFHKEDVPHLFERFYRGRNAKESSIGIGLPLAKAIIEMQNGVIRANNIESGGACFEIRIYSH